MESVIDNGKTFDWGKSSDNYALYRDIYPREMYDEMFRLGFGGNKTLNLDIGTGTGVIPRFMCSYGGKFFGVDISENQILKAKELSDGLDIDYSVAVAENLPFENDYFDAVSAVQCWRYFDKEKAVPEICRVLKSKGVFIICYMQWLPEESPIIEMSHNLVKKYNSLWDCFDKRIEVENSTLFLEGFEKKEFLDFDCEIPFTRESWNGRMIACRGIEPSLSPAEVKSFSDEHMKMLCENTDEEFTLKHQIALFCFEKI